MSRWAHCLPPMCPVLMATRRRVRRSQIRWWEQSLSQPRSSGGAALQPFIGTVRLGAGTEKSQRFLASGLRASQTTVLISIDSLKNLCSRGRRRNPLVSGMGSVTHFHPEWGCLAPAPGLIRTMRTVFVATAVGAVAGGGLVLSLAAHPAGGQTSVAERTLVRVLPVASTSTGPSEPSTEKISHREPMAVGLPEIQVSDPAPSELNANSGAGQTVVKTFAKVRTATDGSSGKAAVGSQPTIPMRPRHVAKRPRHDDLARSSRPSPQSLASRADTNLVQRVWTGLTAAIEHVWPFPTLPANGTSSTRGEKRTSMRTTLS